MRTKKKLLFALLFTALLIILPSKVFADVTDDAQLFSVQQIQELNQLAEKIEQKTKAKVYVTTTNQNDGTEKEYATEFLRKKVGNNKNGVVFLIDMSQRGYQITTSGNMIDFLTDSRIKAIKKKVQEALSSGEYYLAANAYLHMTSDYVDKGVPGGHYYIDSDTGKITRYKVLTATEAMIALIVAFSISLVVFFSIKASYQMKRSRSTYEFREKATVDLHTQTDNVLRTWVTTRQLPRQNDQDNDHFDGGGSTTYSSGGGTFGGGGGKF